MSSDVDNEMQKLIPRKEQRSDVLTEADLKAEREKRGRIEIAQEMLSVGWSVRETSQELKLPKSLVEKLSKKLNSSEHPRGGFRQAWNEKPYKEALARDEETEDEGGLLDSGWFERIQRKIWKMKIEQSLMRKAGLIGDDGEEKRSGSNIDLNQILIAKVVSSGGNINGQELISFATALKSLFAPQQSSTADPIEIFEKLQNVQNQGVKNYQQIEATVRANVASSENKGIIKEAIELAKPLLSRLGTAPSNIPQPTPSIPPPLTVTQSELENLSLPQHLPVAEPLPAGEGVPIADQIGYSNLNRPDLTRKTELR